MPPPWQTLHAFDCVRRLGRQRYVAASNRLHGRQSPTWKHADCIPLGAPSNRLHGAASAQ
eukprot:5534160-Pyramimonas_sp.AAC.1